MAALAPHRRGVGAGQPTTGSAGTGQVPRSSPGAERTCGTIVTKVVHAAYGAFQSGLEISLVVVGIAILVGAVVSLAALERHRPPRHESPSAALPR